MSNLTAISPSTGDDGVGQKSERTKNVIVRSVFRPRGHATIDTFPPCACTKFIMFVLKQSPVVGHGLTRVVCSCAC